MSTDERLERALREIKRAGLERAIVGRLLADMSDEDVSSLVQVGTGLLGAIERMSIHARASLRAALGRRTREEREAVNALYHRQQQVRALMRDLGVRIDNDAMEDLRNRVHAGTISDDAAAAGLAALIGLEHARTDVGRASSRGPCAHCGLPVCYCCPECGREVTEHAPDCQSDPARQGATT